MGEHHYNQGKGKNKKQQQHNKGHGHTQHSMKDTKTFNRHGSTAPQPSRIRKQVDPEISKYLLEIANLFESNAVELEERTLICGNALEETKGFEFEVATDYILSHTLETIIQGSDVEHLCAFLQSCADNFPAIAMDRSGSHVAEAILKSLSTRVQDNDARPQLEEALTTVCKVMAASSVEVMRNCYGSHVLRTLLCLCKGVPLDKSEYYFSKAATVLAGRLNLNVSKKHDATKFQSGFPNLLKLFVSEMLKNAGKSIKTLQVDPFSSFVFQTTLRVLAGNDEELLHVIPILLGCKDKRNPEGSFLEDTVVAELIKLSKEAEFSHLMEVVLEVSPEALFNELFTKVFRNSLFELSSHQHGNFVVQALISHTSNQDLMRLIWDELGSNLEDLFKMGRSGVVAALIAASERLHFNEHKCCQFLAKTVCSADESPKCIVPRLLFLDSYFSCEDKSNWSWQSGDKMHVMGSLILQAIFRFKSEYIKPYIISITSMETPHVLEAVRDAKGSHVIEAFLSSSASEKEKCRLVKKLESHFGKVAAHSSGAFVIEKCFTACNLSLRESIVSELLAVRSELSKTKQGSHLLRKLDVDWFASHPDRWRSKQASKEFAYKDFSSTFGSSDTKPRRKDRFLAGSSNNKSNPKTVTELRKEINQSLGTAAPFLSKQKFKRKSEQKGKNIAKVGDDNNNFRRGKKMSNKKKVGNKNDTAATATARKSNKKRQRDGDVREASLKKMKDNID
ncbi:hypothetical protein HN51_039984 [Arachis hypogaea]|nr:pumilio homolog 23 [Arachis ipaensis]XP_025663171.1 pumilio homolog 23 [Arachis hypogaea]QHN85663.1 uncharacterized protein DS421_16g539270 [Arachis hypogaea]